MAFIVSRDFLVMTVYTDKLFLKCVRWCILFYFKPTKHSLDLYDRVLVYVETKLEVSSTFVSECALVVSHIRVCIMIV